MAATSVSDKGCDQRGLGCALFSIFTTNQLLTEKCLLEKHWLLVGFCDIQESRKGMFLRILKQTLEVAKSNQQPQVAGAS